MEEYAPPIVVSQEPSYERSQDFPIGKQDSFHRTPLPSTLASGCCMHGSQESERKIYILVPSSSVGHGLLIR